MLSALWSTGTSCLKPAEPHTKRTSAWKAAPPADPALEGCLPVSARSQTYPCTQQSEASSEQSQEDEKPLRQTTAPIPTSEALQDF